ncbi:MAG: type I 3-dehydroquinate dehydratase [Pseudobutyrivibrio sp.]|nr:type I 3-dehydroquinate dehydratase [Pseudobutyrivibrio sp.]
MSKKLFIKDKYLSSDKLTVCVPIVAATKEALIQQVQNAVKAQADMIELRADFFTFLRDKDALADALDAVSELTPSTMVLFTIRTKLEGGEIDISEEDYKNILLFASTTGMVDIIDVETSHIREATHFVNLLRNNGVYVLASHHDFQKTPELLDMTDIYDQMQQTGADILKLAVMPEDSAQVLRALKAADIANEEYDEELVVVISMGKLGMLTRIAGPLVGSCITFAALEKSSAPGQIDYEDMNIILQILDKNGDN